MGMCGIAGIADSRLSPEQCAGALDRMKEALYHRGPDEVSSVVFPGLRAGLACCRLAIVDLVTGSQPISSEDGAVHVVCNGEIYNHRELRRLLERKGHRFRSSTDVEVIAHLYEEYATDCLAHLHGMFGLAILDGRRRRLVLARDRCGMKPLFHAVTPHGFLFASEPGALLATGLLPVEPDWAGLDTGLAAGFIPAPRSAFRGIEKLKGGDFLVVDEGQVRKGTYWRLRYRDEPRRSEREYAEEFESRLEDAVKSHLAADVPVGIFISGGWDSSLVAWKAARAYPGRLKTFSIVFPEHPRMDERPYSRRMAEFIGSEHHEVEFHASAIPQLLPKVARHLGEPCLTAPALLFYQLSSLASTSVKTVVGGEGSDELFAGYSWLRSLTDVHYRLRRIVPRFLSRYPAQRVRSGPWRRLWRVLAAKDDLSADAEWHRCFTSREKDQWFSPDHRSERPDLLPLRLDPETLGTCRGRLQRRLALEFTRRLPEGILLTGDRMSMAHSLEVRMPFLDYGMVEFAAGLPSDMKRRGRQEKYVESLLAAQLPPEIARRKKLGLAMPTLECLVGPLRGFVREFLLDSNGVGGLLNRQKLESWLSRPPSRRGQELRAAWSLMMLQAWWNEYIGGR